MLLPTVIIAGAPKCGTTSLFSYLAVHPSVCASVVKETCFLIDPDYPLYRPERNFLVQGLEGYSEFFERSDKPSANVYLEATPDYLYQRTPLEVLPKFDSMPLIIFVLRKPSERVYSLFRFAQNNVAVLDSATQFKDFLEMVKTNDSRFEKRPILKNAIDHSRYVEFIDRWRAIVGGDLIHIIIFEEMAKHPEKCMRDLCAILNIEPSYYDSFAFETKNATETISNATLHRFKRKYANLMTEGVLRRGASWLYRLINISQISNIEKSQIDLELIDLLEKEFIHYNNKLAERYNLDISLWL